MRLIDADALDWWNDLYMKGVNHSGVWVRYRDVEEFIKSAPTVEAIPIEQVARMMASTDMPPCDVEKLQYVYGYGCNYWCYINCVTFEKPNEHFKCWLHAIKEGWLDDAE